MITEAHIGKVDQFLQSHNFNTKERMLILDLPMLRALQSRLKDTDDSLLSIQAKQIRELFSVANPELGDKISDPPILQGIKDALH